MIILGKLTGKQYLPKDKHRMKECGIQITYEQALDEDFINAHHIRDMLDCSVCLGCPEAQKRFGVDQHMPVGMTR